MLYLAIPAQNEVATIGVLLWRLRTVLAEFPREYEVVVYDDASSDETAAVAEQYVHAMPVTVLRGTKSVGYAGAVDALARYIAGQTRYPRRDAMLLLQGDFTDPPGIVPEFARRFEGGADLVVGERNAVADAPQAVRRLFTASGWALKPFVRVDGIRDLTGSMRLVRISALRDLLRTVGDAPVCEGDSWTANADLLLRLVPHARRVESVPVEPTYGVRTRESRRITVRDGLAALRWAWRARGRKATPTTAPESAATDAPQRGARPANTPRRRDEGEVTADALRERSRERDRLRGESEAAPSRRDGRPERGRREGARDATRETARDVARDTSREPAKSATPAAKRERDPARDAARDARKQEQRDTRRTAAKDGSAARPPREKRARDGAERADDADLLLDDPFAARTPRPAAAEGKPARDEAPQTVDVEDASALPLSGSPARRESLKAHVEARDDGDATSDADDETTQSSDAEDADSNAADDAADASTGGEARERKRRRNRRSRRRKNRQRGEAGAESASEPASADSVSADSASVDAGHANAAPSDDTNRRSDNAAAKPRRQIDADDEGADDGPDDESDDNSESEPAAEGQEGSDGQRARSRRRGRRGRRGGSRRGRGRNREGAPGGEGATEGGAGAGGEAAPSDSPAE